MAEVDVEVQVKLDEESKEWLEDDRGADAKEPSTTENANRDGNSNDETDIATPDLNVEDASSKAKVVSSVIVAKKDRDDIGSNRQDRKRSWDNDRRDRGRQDWDGDRSDKRRRSGEMPRSRDPYEVPSGGYFFDHDDRDAGHAGGRRGGGDSFGRRGRSSAADTNQWKHDLFDQLDKEPSTQDSGGTSQSQNISRDRGPPARHRDGDDRRSDRERDDSRRPAGRGDRNGDRDHNAPASVWVRGGHRSSRSIDDPMPPRRPSGAPDREVDRHRGRDRDGDRHRWRDNGGRYNGRQQSGDVRDRDRGGSGRNGSRDFRDRGGHDNGDSRYRNRNQGYNEGRP